MSIIHYGIIGPDDEKNNPKMDFSANNIKRFCIELYRSDGVYMAGEIITGYIHIDLVCRQNILKLQIRANGKAVIKIESRPINDELAKSGNHIVHITKMVEESYFQYKNNLLVALDDDSFFLSQGVNRVPFSFKIPPKVPCSFEHKHGYIRYTIRAIIKRRNGFDIDCKAAFTVIANYDLKLRPTQCLGISRKLKQNSCCAACIEEPKYARLTLPMRGFVPGMPVELITFIETNCESHMQVNFKLEQCIIFTLQSSDTTVRQESLMIELSVIKINYTKQVSHLLETSYQVIIPPLPPSELEFCNIIHLKYNLHFIFTTKGHNDINLSLPILIGTTGTIDKTKFVLQSSLESDEILIKKILPVSLIFSNKIINTSDTNTDNITYMYGEFQTSETSKTDNIREGNDGIYTFGIKNPFQPKYPVYICPK